MTGYQLLHKSSPAKLGEEIPMSLPKLPDEMAIVLLKHG